MLALSYLRVKGQYYFLVLASGYAACAREIGHTGLYTADAAVVLGEVERIFGGRSRPKKKRIHKIKGTITQKKKRKRSFKIGVLASVKLIIVARIIN